MTTALPSRPPSIFRGILLNTGWLTIARASGDVAGILLFIGISRNLGLEAIGQYSYAFAVGTLTAALVGLGMEEFGLREYSRLDTKSRRAMFGDIMGLQLILVIVVVAALAVLLTFAPHARETKLVVVVVTIHVLTFQFANMFFIPSFAGQKMLLPAVAEFVCRVGALVASLLLVTVTKSTLAVTMAPLAVGTTLLMVFALGSAKHFNIEYPLGLPWRRVPSILAAIWPFAVFTILYNIFNRIAIIILAALRGEEAAGIYGTALKLYEFGLMPFFLLGVAAFPALSRSFAEDPGEFGKTAEKVFTTCVLGGALLCWGLVFVAPPLLVLVLGEEFEVARSATRLMGIVACLAAIDAFALRLMLAMHLQKQRMKIQALAVVVQVALLSALVPVFGVTGAIAATVGAQVLMIAGYFVCFGRSAAARHLIRAMRTFVILVSIVVLTGVGLFLLEVGEHYLAIGTFVALVLTAMMMNFLPMPLRRARN
jgi:O-antigen/teichoic acid export membrane protein